MSLASLILYQDKNFIVLNKPSGYLTVPPRIPDERPILGRLLEKELGQQIYPVHRLDFEVSGVVLFALNAKAHTQANDWFEHKKVQKKYFALTSGPSFSHIPANVPKHFDLINPQRGDCLVWESRLLKGKKRSYIHAEGKLAVTKACFQGVNEKGYCQWELEPVTGRSHQLRCELSQRGFPILGDHLYGSLVSLKPQEIALQAYELIFLENQLPTIKIEKRQWL